MARPVKLTAKEIEESLRKLEGWTVSEGKLNKTFQFKDFIEAWGFMSRAALIAQSIDRKSVV